MAAHHPEALTSHDNHGHADHGHGGHGQPQAGSVIDLVCGMTVDPHKTPHRAEHAGHPYYFCSAGCRSKFVADPARYLGEVKEPESVPEGTIYTCPMHPEIRQVGPGSCPICGMALEPELVTARNRLQSRTGGHDPPLLDRHGVSLPLVVLEMGAHLAGTHGWIRPTNRTGFNSRWRPRSCCGPAGRSLCVAGSRCSHAISTCSR